MIDEDVKNAPSSPWPKRTTTEVLNHKAADSYKGIDVTVWDDLLPHVRDGDIVINSVFKSGTTWTTQVILQMLNGGEETLFAPENRIYNVAPWVENVYVVSKAARVANFASIPPRHRRVVKAHLQLDALLFSPKLRYVCIFRDGRDNVISLHNHVRSLTDELRAARGYADPTNFDAFYENFLNSNQPFWYDYFSFLKSWWSYGNSCDNILLLNYNEMKLDLGKVVVKLAKFLDIDVGEPASARFQNILRHSSFEYMKEHQELFEPPAYVMHPGKFIHKGMIGRWRDTLSEAQHRAYWDKIDKCWPPELVDFVHNDALQNPRPPEFH